MRRARGLVQPCRGRSEIRKAPVVCRGFSYLAGLERTDSVAEFVGEAWFGIACEEFLVFDDFAEFGEPVA